MTKYIYKNKPFVIYDRWYAWLAKKDKNRLKKKKNNIKATVNNTQLFQYCSFTR